MIARGRGRLLGDHSRCLEARAGREHEREPFGQRAEHIVLADLAHALADRHFLDQLAAAKDQRAIRSGELGGERSGEGRARMRRRVVVRQLVVDRVLRFEQIATEIPPDFPITAASSLIDYDWVSINERKYLLPTHSEILLTTVNPKFVLQSRNDIKFRSYQKFGAELKVIDEIDEDDFPPEKPDKP